MIRKLLIWSVAVTCFSGNPCHAWEEILAEGWEVFDVGVGIKPAIDFGADGRIHVMGMTERFSGVVWHATADSASGPWAPNVVQTGYFYGPGDIRVDDQGVAHLAWHDHDVENAAYAQVSPSGNVTSRQVINTAGTHDGWDNSLAFDSSGNLFQAHVDPSNFGATTSLQFAAFDGQGWSSQKIAGSGPFMYGFNTALAFDNNDDPHILFTQADDWTTVGDLKHAFRSNDQWQVETVVTGGARGRFPTLVFDDDNRAHAAWYDIESNNGSTGTIRYGVYENGQWTTSDVDRLNDVTLGFTGTRKMVSIDLDSSGDPAIGYGDQQAIHFATRQGNEWNEQIVLEADDVPYNGMVVMRFNPVTDLPTMVFWQSDGDDLVRIVSMLPTDQDSPGDFNNDGILDANDVDLLARAVSESSNDSQFDLNEDALVNSDDHTYWIKNLKNTYFGDSNLDGEFNSEDFVQVFAAGKYEDGVLHNSGWAEGDWNGNREFESTDFVYAFRDGGFEKGPRTNLTAVPEPHPSILLFLVSLMTMVRHYKSGLAF